MTLEHVAAPRRDRWGIQAARGPMSRRLHGASSILTHRATTARAAAAVLPSSSRFAAMLRGKAAAYREAIALLERLQSGRALPGHSRDHDEAAGIAAARRKSARENTVLTELEQVLRIARSPVNEISTVDRDWYDAHPLRHLVGIEVDVLDVVAGWLRERE